MVITDIQRVQEVYHHHEAQVMKVSGHMLAETLVGVIMRSLYRNRMVREAAAEM